MTMRSIAWALAVMALLIVPAHGQQGRTESAFHGSAPRRASLSPHSAFRICRARSAIHDLCAYFAFVNRIADGLGVELERLQP